MAHKAAFVIGLATGYVLGSKAGRERYDQIAKITKKVSENPSVKRSTDAVQAQATNLSAQAKRMMQQKAGTIGHDVMEKVTNRLPEGMRPAKRQVDLDAASRTEGAMT
jgi:hypothetical protein